ncbi:MAG: type 1 glutamine amidotransferase [Candidatus Omnitrophica bacterium]|nr:type 1 glutamine amidotransferase [Candidatus Omnitrophota bacterium]
MKQVAILVEDQYQELEVWYPYLRLKEEGIKAVFLGPEKKQYKSKLGYPVEADLGIKNAKPGDFSGVIIPGGWAPDLLRRYREINQFVRSIFDEDKLVASICHGGWVLVSAGILRGKKATSFFAIKDDLLNAGAEFIDKEVVVDKNLITSRNPYDLPVFCLEAIKFLKK